MMLLTDAYYIKQYIYLFFTVSSGFFFSFSQCVLNSFTGRNTVFLLTEIQFTYYKVGHFIVYALVAFNIFTRVCNYH